MAREVELRVKGLAFCYIRDRAWNVVLVSDSDHPMTLTAPGMNPTNLRKGNKDLLCEFMAPTLMPAADPTFPNAMALNMSDTTYGHGANAQGVSNLRFIRANKFGTLTLRLPHSTLTLENPRDEICWMQRVVPGGSGPKQQVTQIAEDWVFKFNLTSNAANALQVIVSDKRPGSEFDATFPPNANPGPLQFVLDNSCGLNCKRNDSIDLYDVFIDKTDEDKKFVSGALDEDGEVPGHKPALTPSRAAKTQGSAPVVPPPPSPMHGNCDPVGSDPPPWP